MRRVDDLEIRGAIASHNASEAAAHAESDSAAAGDASPAERYDRISPSRRAIALLAGLAPLAIRVFHFWDHRTTRLTIDHRTVEVDASGCYHLT